MTLSPDFLDEVRARTTLSALVQRTVSLKKAGREWKACCPFHNEKSPSFWVNDEKAFYHCFGCGAHGDAIRWMTDHMGLEFIDAVKELVQAAGMEMPARDDRQGERDAEMQRYRDIMARAQDYFSMVLTTKAGEPARAYLAERGIDQAQIDKFGIGFAPGRQSKALHETISDMQPGLLEHLGLVKIKPDTGEIYDAFRRRIMFPIHDQRGRVVGFGGRILGEGQPKYLNSPDTPLFDKGRMLFNMHRAAPAARAGGPVVIVEGYMDVVAMARGGVDAAIAPNGTALTEDQIRLAWRLADEPICCFDGDSAGEKAATRAALRALPMLEPGKSLRFVTPPAGQDPDDVVRGGGAAAIAAMIAAPTALVDVLWRAETTVTPVRTPEQVAGLKGRLREHVRAIRSKDVRDAYGAALSAKLEQQFRLPPAPPARTEPERTPFRRREQPASQAQQQINSTGIGGGLEMAILSGLMIHPDLIEPENAAGWPRFRNTAIAAAYEALANHAMRQGTLDGDEARAVIEAMSPSIEIPRTGIVHLGYDALRDSLDALREN